MESMEMDDGVGWSRKRRCVRTKEKKKRKRYIQKGGVMGKWKFQGKKEEKEKQAHNKSTIKEEEKRRELDLFFDVVPPVGQEEESRGGGAKDVDK